jgi:hypothetical protein
MQPNPFAHCPNLTSIDASYAEKVVDLGWIGRCTALAELNLSYCPTLSSTTFAAVATGFSGELRLQRLGLCPGFRAVVRLCVTFCAGLTDLRLHPFVALEELDVSCCRNLRCITGLAPDADDFDGAYTDDDSSVDSSAYGAGSGEYRRDDEDEDEDKEEEERGDGNGEGQCSDEDDEAKVGTGDGVSTGEAADVEEEDVEGDWHGNHTLRVLKCSSCSALSSLPDLHRCRTLEELDLSGCKLLAPTALVPLGRTSCAANTLRLLNLSRCPQLDAKALAFVGKLRRLQSLDLNHCRRLAKLPSGIAECTELHTLIASNCARLRTIGALTGCPALRSIDTRFCPRLK